MGLLGKWRSRCGMTLVEVLVVVAIMMILLGIAMPDLLAGSQSIKLAEMNGYARSVAVAVQSRLYGMKNGGTSLGSEYWTLNETAATNVGITGEGGTETVKCVSNFGTRGAAGKQMLLSGAITDPELLREGKIAVLYDPVTADVIEAYYSENEFDLTSLLGAEKGSYRKSHTVGYYRGESAPAPEIVHELPKPILDVKNGEELLVEVKFPEIDPELYGTRVALEYYVANANDPNQEALIYSEGANATDPPILLGALDGKTLSLALDSYVIPRLEYAGYKMYLDCFQPSATAVSLLNSDKSLYPRQQLDVWLDLFGNPYMSDWVERERGDVEEQKQQIYDYFQATGEFISVGVFDMSEGGAFDQWLRPQGASLADFKNWWQQGQQAWLLPLVQTSLDSFPYAEYSVLNTLAKGEFVKIGDEILVTVAIRAVDDDTLQPQETTSAPCNAYYYRTDGETVQVASIRHLQNLSGALKDNLFGKAELFQSIDVDEGMMPLYRSVFTGLGRGYPELAGNLQVTWFDVFFHNYCARFDPLDAKDFIFDGKGHELKNLYESSYGVTGLFGVAYRCKIKDLRLVNVTAGSIGLDRRTIPQRENYTDAEGFHQAEFDQAVKEYQEKEAEWRINVGAVFGAGIELADGDNSAKVLGQRRDTFLLSNSQTQGKATSYTGTLVGVAINCEITNCYVYTEDEDGIYDHLLGGIVSGGLVGFALGYGGETKIGYCLAATQTIQDGGSVYCGGLVGLTMGNVTIQNCYSAGYYVAGCNGGLVALALPHGTVSFDLDDFGLKSSTAMTGTTRIANCFGAGVAYYSETDIRIGGLIGEVKTDGLSVLDCYAAMRVHQTFDSAGVEPKVFGTFEGDEANEYIVQGLTNYSVRIAYEGSSGIACGNVGQLQERFADNTAWTTDNGTDELFPTDYFEENPTGFPYPRLFDADGNVMPQYGYWLTD